MKIILLQDVAKIGYKYDVKDLANGYAEYLIRQGKAEFASSKKMEHLEAKKKLAKAANKENADKLLDAINQIVKEGISIVAKANEQGHLFEKITVDKITEAIVDAIVEIPSGVVVLQEPIKEIGEYEIELVNGSDVHKAKLVISTEE